MKPILLKEASDTVKLRKIVNFYKVPLKYGAYSGLFFWVFECLVNNNLFNLSSFLVLFSISTSLMLFLATLNLLDREYLHPNYIRQIRNRPAFVEIEVIRNFKFLQELNCFSGLYKGFSIHLSFNFDEKSEKLQTDIYVEKDEQIAAQIRMRDRKLDVTELSDCLEITMKRSIPFAFEDLEFDLDKLVELLKESGARNAVFADSE